MNGLKVISEYGARIDEDAKKFLARDPYDLYGMLAYFMGYTDAAFKPISTVVGKRVRPGLALYIAEAYGDQQAARRAALSIELFHNFSLIHDDIEDHDEIRRGRETVWKVWGTNKALNAGDAQVILSIIALADDSEGRSTARAIESHILTQFLKVIEGQHQDFSLAELPLSSELVSQVAYMDMIQKKSAELISASVVVGGVAAGAPAADGDALRVFGLELGLAYQLQDDSQSIWGTEHETGKKVMGDLVERKKTLPSIYARDVLATEDKQALIKLFDVEKVANPELIRKLLNKAGAKQYVESETKKHKRLCLSALATLSIADDHKVLLESFVHELIPLP